MARRHAGVIAGLFYLALVVVMWAPYTLYSGMGYESHFAYTSETSSGLDAFFFHVDPLRIHTSFFYHLSYVLGEAVGAGGSYVPYQIVHAMLWWLRGLLVFLLVRRLLPGQLGIAYVAGALVLVHAADGALQWAGQINQFGFIFWMLLACYTAVRSVDAARTSTAVILGGCAVVFAHMSLWSYEAQLLLLCIWPALLVWLRWPARRRAFAVAACWYGVIAVYVALTIAAYGDPAASASYQMNVMRQTWDVGSLAADWWFNIVESLSFLRWRRGPIPERDRYLALLATAIFLGGAAAVFKGMTSSGHRSTATTWSTLAGVCGIGALLLVSSFPVYLLLDSVRGLWRTQLLSGIGAALTLTGTFAVAGRVSGRRLELPVLVSLGALVVWFGSAAAIGLGAIHRGQWEQHRATLVEILRAAPSVKPGTLIALMNVPTGADPFGDDMWFDMGTRLLYPGTPVVGVYFRDDGSPAPGNNMLLDGDRWFWDGTGYPPAVREVRLANTVIVSLDASGKAVVATALPPGLCLAFCSANLYDPASVIGGSPSDRAVRRYRAGDGPES